MENWEERSEEQTKDRCEFEFELRIISRSIDEWMRWSWLSAARGINQTERFIFL